MANLTRILNNQIYGKTIIASQKIADGTITGPLFASNVTVPGDFLITGNLFVLGSSQTTTVASTNTYVNDPLIVLNNGFAGTNTYDEGLIFNRGTADNKAFVWSETFKEFRLITTAEGGTTYGNITSQLGLANLSVGKFYTSGTNTTAGNIDQVGTGVFGVTVAGNIGLNGPYVTTTQGQISLFNTNATTVNAFGAATTLTVGATTGTLTLRNATVTTPGQIVSTRAGSATTNDGQIYLNGATSNRIDWAAAGTGAPAFTTRTAGAKVVLYPALSGSTTDYAIGIDTSTMWHGVPENNDSFNFKWYGAETLVANLSGAGNFTTVGAVVINSTNPSSSSATGALIVKGGVGIGGNLNVAGDATIIGNLTVLGNTIAVASNNLVVSDSIIELHYVNGGNITVNDGRDIGLRMHFNRGAGNDNAALVLANDTGFLEWYGTGVQETANINIAGTYGTIKAGNLLLVGNLAGVGSTTYNNGALVAAGGAGINGNVNISRTSRLTLGLDLLSNVVYNDTPVQFVTSSNTFSRVSVQNINSGQNATSDFIAMSDTGSNVTNYVVTGIASSTFNSAAVAPVILPNDGYTFTSTGNLVISGGRDLVFSANGLSEVGVRISKDFSNVGVQFGKQSTNELDGAFTVIGGAGFYSNINVGLGAAFNTRQESYANSAVRINGAADSTLFVAVPGADSIVINGQGNALPQLGTSAKFGGNGAIVVPVGTTAQRPSTAGNVDVAGMVRFNSTTNALEYYDGSAWQIAGSVFTVISDRQFAGNVAGGYGNVDGTNTTFTLQSNATTSGTIVSINGVMQFPTLAYSVSGATLEFTEPPAPNDVIDARILTTTSTIATVASSTGLNQFVADENGSSIWTGLVTTTERLRVDPVGDINILTGSKLTYTQAVINVPATGATLIDSWSKTGYTTAKYIIQSKVGSTNVESYEALIMTDGSSGAYVTTYGIINNGTSFGTITANVSGSNVNVYYNTTIAQANVKAFGTFIL